MQKLLTRETVPPDGFRYRQPETGKWSISETYDNWVKQAYEHIKGNQLPMPPNLQQVMEQQLCSTLPPGWCEEFDPNRVEPLTRMHRGDIIEGMKVFSIWFLQGQPFVDQVEAERRAAICANCYLNVQVEGCTSCHKVAEDLTSKVSTSLDSKLQACAVCKCLLRAKVHFPLDILNTTDSDWKQNTYPDFCWLKKDGPNYFG